MLANKALSHGGIVESVDTFYPSSKLCSQCGNKKTDLKLKDRIYACASPFCRPICRDLNSSINLKNVPLDKIVARVGSIRSNVCLHSSADTCGFTEADAKVRKQKVNPIARQLLLPLSD